MNTHRVFHSIIALLIISLLAGNAFAQVRKTKPEPGPAPKAAFPAYHETTLSNGLKVLIVTNNSQPLVTFRLMIKSGSEHEPREKSGIASFVSELLTKGTKNRTSLAFAKESDFLGISINAGSGDDAMTVSGSGLKKHANKILELMTDALLNPTFPDDELEKAKKQTLSGLTSERKDPDAISGRLMITVGYNENPYSQFSTENTVNAITRDDLVAFHETFYIPNNASLAIVGDMTPKEALPLLEKYFGGWQKGELPKASFLKAKPISERTVHLVDLGATQTQTTLSLLTGGLVRNDPDYIPLSVTNSIVGGGFSGRLFQNLREKHGFTYGAYSDIDARKHAGLWSAAATVRREATDSSIFEILKEIRRIREEPVSEDELNLHKNYLTGTYLLSLERASTTATRLQDIDLYDLPKDYYKNYVSNIMKLSTDDLQRVARKYLSPEDIAITAVGDANAIKATLEKFGPVQLYDPDMKPVEASTELPLDTDAESLLQKHVEALGGVKALSVINERIVESDMTMNFGGHAIEASRISISKAPNKSYDKMTLSFGGQTMEQEKWNDGKTVMETQMGQGVKTFSGEELSQELEKDQFNEIIRWKELGYKPVLISKKLVEGKPVYVLEMKRKHSTSVWHISAETYLLMRDESSINTDRGPVTVAISFSDYRKVDGVMLPFAMTVDAGMTSFDMKVKSYKHNTGISDDVFRRK